MIRHFALGLLPIALGACWSHLPAADQVDAPAPSVTRVDPGVREFDGHLDVGGTYLATLVRPPGLDTWMPAAASSAKAAVRVAWSNPEALAGLADRNPPDRRVVFEVISRDLDDPGLFHCRVQQIAQ